VVTNRIFVFRLALRIFFDEFGQNGVGDDVVSAGDRVAVRKRKKACEGVLKKVSME
jgi:hypothetical protein